MIAYNYEDKWQIQFDCLSRFIFEWYGIKEDQNANVNNGQYINIPLPLLYFYKKYQNDFSRIFYYNNITPFNELKIENERLTFLVESQGVFVWQTEAVEGDPRVFVSENIDPNKWFIEDERLCGFIYQQLLFEAIMNCKYHCTTSWIDCGKLDLIVDRWKKAPFKPMRWPEYPAEFYYKDKAIAFTYPNENGFTFHCGSNKPLELCFMVDLIDDTWEDVHIG